MRVGVLGAGAIGGYFGGRLLQAGRDVTFLVRPQRARRLAETGLRVRSRFGDLDLARPPTALAGEAKGPFDLVILAAKAYDLGDAMDTIAPAIGPSTAILPLLNGMSHLDALDARFGAERVLGGLCHIGSTLEPDGTIRHLNDIHSLTYGERDGGDSPRLEAIRSLFAGALFEPRETTQILLAMWEKWVFLASLAAGTCLMRAPVGDIVAAPGGRDFMLGLVEESAAIAAASGFPPRPEALDGLRKGVTAPGSPMAASMSRDIAGGGRIEADHVIGDLIRRGRERSVPTARFDVAYTHLKAYEARRDREAAHAHPN